MVGSKLVNRVSFIRMPVSNVEDGFKLDKLIAVNWLEEISGSYQNMVTKIDFIHSSYSFILWMESTNWRKDGKMFSLRRAIH